MNMRLRHRFRVGGCACSDHGSADSFFYRKEEDHCSEGTKKASPSGDALFVLRSSVPDKVSAKPAHYIVIQVNLVPIKSILVNDQAGCVYLVSVIELTHNSGLHPRGASDIHIAGIRIMDGADCSAVYRFECFITDLIHCIFHGFFLLVFGCRSCGGAVVFVFVMS